MLQAARSAPPLTAFLAGQGELAQITVFRPDDSDTTYYTASILVRGSTIKARLTKEQADAYTPFVSAEVAFVGKATARGDVVKIAELVDMALANKPEAPANPTDATEGNRSRRSAS